MSEAAPAPDLEAGADAAVIEALAIENANLKVRCIRLEHALRQLTKGEESGG